MMIVNSGGLLFELFEFAAGGYGEVGVKSSFADKEVVFNEVLVNPFIAAAFGVVFAVDGLNCQHFFQKICLVECHAVCN